VSNVVPNIRDIRENLESLNPTYCKQLVTDLLKSVKIRLIKYEKNNLYIASPVGLLDPRFKVKWCKENQPYREVCKSAVLQDMIKYAAAADTL